MDCWLGRFLHPLQVSITAWAVAIFSAIALILSAHLQVLSRKSYLITGVAITIWYVFYIWAKAYIAPEPLGIPQGWTLIFIFYIFLMFGLPFRICFPLGIAAATLDSVAQLVEQAPGIGDNIVMSIAAVVAASLAAAELEKNDRAKWQHERVLLESIHTDDLTKLRNRRYLFNVASDSLQNAINQKISAALLLIDVDYFKRFNDTYGHPTGDRCLQAVAQALHAAPKHHSSDVIARIGGEEFVVLMIDCNAAQATAYALTLHSAIAALGIPNSGSPFGNLTISIGLAIAADGSHSDLGALIKAADEALYRSKGAGRNLTSG